jgi:hypothetical protein
MLNSKDYNHTAAAAGGDAGTAVVAAADGLTFTFRPTYP